MKKNRLVLSIGIPFLIVLSVLLMKGSGSGIFSKPLPNGVNPSPTPYDKYITLKGIKYYYRQYPGKKKDIVLVHGMPSSSYTWDGVIPELQKEGFRVWCLDLKGFGWSDKPKNSKYDILVIAKELNGWMEAMKLKNVHVVGHSWGALLCMILAIEYPDKVDRLVLLDSVCYPQEAPVIMRLARLPFAGDLAGIVMQRWLLKAHMKDLFFHPEALTEDKIDAYYNRMRTDNMLNAQVEIIRQLLDKENETYIKNYPRIKARTLIVAGGNDKWISPDMTFQLKKDIRNSSVVIIPECGHFPQEELPVITSKLISDFADGVKVQETTQASLNKIKHGNR